MSSRQLLRDALTVWRETRAEAIAEVIEQITTQLSRGWQPPSPKLHRTFQVAWLAAAADDVHRGWAARTILDRLPDRACVRARLTALLAAGPDPRVSRELDLQLDTLAGFGDLVLQVIGAAGELRSPTKAELAHFAPPALLAELATLERDVYANPDDDEPRAVLADLLQTRGDPRGELIALQLAAAAGRIGDEGDARIEALVRDHGRGWLGPLDEIASRAELRRGFLTRLELAAERTPWPGIVQHPLLGTVEDLLPGQSTGARYAELVASPAMTSLRRIEVFDVAVIEALKNTPARLVHVACPPLQVDNPSRQFAEVVWPACARFETLRSVACPLSAVPELMRSPIGARLTTLTVSAEGSGEVTAALAFWRSFRRPLELVIAPHARLRGCGRVEVEGEGSIGARREHGEVILRVEGPWATAICKDYRSLLPAARLEIVGPTTRELASRIGPLSAENVEIVRIPRERSAGVIPAL